MTTIGTCKRVAVVATSSVSAGATAELLRPRGFHVVAVARRADRITAAAESAGPQLWPMSRRRRRRSVIALSRVDVLVQQRRWRQGLQFVPMPIWVLAVDVVNVLGTLQVTAAAQADRLPATA